MNLYEGAYRGDRDEHDISHTIPATCVTLAGLAFLLAAALLLRSAVQTLLGRNLTSQEVFELLLTRWTLGWFGLLFLGWGVCEFFCKVPGPRILFSLICVIPVLAPFGFLGYGREIEAWSSVLEAGWFLRTGELLSGSLSTSPLFFRLLTFLEPLGGWTAVFTVHLTAGILAVLTWMWLPGEIVIWRRRLIALVVLLHPLFLMSCGTGLDLVWQTLTVSLSAVLVIHGLTRENLSSYVCYAASGSCLGVAAAFHWPCLVFLPLWIVTTTLFEGSIARRFLSCVVIILCTSALLSAGLAVQPGGFNLQTLILPSLAYDSPHLGYHLLHDVFPPPLIILLLIALWRMRRDWDDLENAERYLSVLSLSSLLCGVILFSLFYESAGSMTVLIPLSAALVAVLVPRTLLTIALPLVALWGVFSVPILPAHPAQEAGLQLTPGRGVLIEETAQRFGMMRKAQQLLLASQKRNTVYVVGEDWPLLAASRPDWIVEKGTLRNPAYPVEFRDWVDETSFRALRLDEYRFYVVGDAGRINREKFGYDLFEEGATSWEP